MTRELVPYRYTSMADHEDQAKRPDGRDASQVEIAVLAPSKAAAARAFGITMGEFNGYAGETGNDRTLEALAAHPPGTVLVGPLAPHDTICGQKGFIPRPGADRIARWRQQSLEASREQNARKAEIRAETQARRDRQEETHRRSEEILAEAAQALEQLGYRPDTVKITQDGSIKMPSEMFADLLRRAAEQAEMEGMGF